VTSQPPATLGQVVAAQRVITNRPSPERVRTIILLLAGSVALMMTGLGIIIPIFARRFEELGGGVQALGLMIMAFALAQFLAAPLLGSLADRYGRRPFVLLSLAAFAVANVGFLLASSVTAFIVVRAVEGALTAGLYPAAMGIVADVAPQEERGRWIGMVMAGYGAGFILGPVVGGLLYDWLGYAAPFLTSALMAVLAFVAAAFVVPETRTAVMRHREELWKRRDRGKALVARESFWKSMPRPLSVFGVLLLSESVLVFAFAFVEPQMIFYLYEDLGWTTVQFGVLVASYGLAVVAGQVTLSRLSDTFARKPVIVIGLVLNALFYAALVFVTSFPLLLLSAVLAGVGEALVLPAVSAFVLDLTAEQHRSRVMGVKESAAALGGVAGPLLVISASAVTTAQGVFAISAVLVMLVAGLALLDLRVSCLGEECWAEAKDYALRRAAVAQATLHGIVTSASSARQRLGG
jgi:DHA1 family tetracycline resistance protein-like MFS transporter